MDDDTTSGRRSVPISALEHYAYCPRQAALIHVDAYFDSNVDTVRGDLAHAAVDEAGAGRDRRRQRVWRSLPVWSETLGIHGVCDVVQFGADGPLPIEHKSGTYRRGGPADLQVAGPGAVSAGDVRRAGAGGSGLRWAGSPTVRGRGGRRPRRTGE